MAHHDTAIPPLTSEPMALLSISCATWLGLLLYLYRARIYPSLTLVLLVGLYELPGLALVFTAFDVPAIESAQRILKGVVTEDTALAHVITIDCFLVAYAIASVFVRVRSGRSRKKATKPYSGIQPTELARPKLNRSLKAYAACLSLLMLVFGIVSSLQDEGTQRLDAYHGVVYEGLRVFSYSLSLVPMVTCTAVLLYACGRRLQPAVMFVASLPMLYEIFLSSRRQFFLPAIFVLIAWRLYGSTHRLSLASLGAILAGILIFFGLQFSVRQEATGVDVMFAESAFEGTIGPQLGELVAVGATSLYSYPLVEERGVTYGMQLVVVALNAVPFAKFGNALFPEVSTRFTEAWKTVAPNGGLSMIAESYLSFGRSGVALLGFILAVLAWKFHQRLIDLFSRKRYTVSNIFFVCIGCVLLGKYRSGVSDALLSSTSLLILFSVVYLLTLVLTQTPSTHRIRSAKNPHEWKTSGPCRTFRKRRNQ